MLDRIRSDPRSQQLGEDITKGGERCGLDRRMDFFAAGLNPGGEENARERQAGEERDSLTKQADDLPDKIKENQQKRARELCARTGGEKGERRLVTAQAPPLLH